MKNGVVKRFTPTLEYYSAGISATVAEKLGGEFVRYEDYLHERQTVEKLRRQLAKRKRRDTRKASKMQPQNDQPQAVAIEQEPTPYDAELHNWHIGKSIWSDDRIVEGKIVNDKKGRFLDNTYVFSSKVIQVRPHHDGLFAYTKHSVYKLVGEKEPC